MWAIYHRHCCNYVAFIPFILEILPQALMNVVPVSGFRFDVGDVGGISCMLAAFTHQQ